MRSVSLIAVLLAFGAHGAQAHGIETGQQLVWTFDPWILTPLAVAGLSYTLGAANLWTRRGIGHGIRSWQAAAYAVGWLSLGGALASPLHSLGERLFSVHMVEHEIVMAIAAPLIVIARPIGGMMWALPRGMRLSLGRFLKRPILQAIWTWLSMPRIATLLHGIAIWAWHAPRLFDAAVTNVVLHRLQHLSFFLTAILFWWAIFRCRDRGVAAWDVFITMLHTSVLGALISLAPRVVYHAQTAHAENWGFLPLEDQQLAGIVMWVPAGTIYAGIAIAFIAHWIKDSSTPARHHHATAQL
jgi:cytochrome c oxidase assembly factor CtaG